MDAMDYVIETEGITKIYGGKKKALDSVDMKIPRGGIFCLLGRNGAGKTTFLRIIGTQLEPTSGRATVLGYDVMKEADEIRPRIAVVPQEAKIWGFATPWDYVYSYARLRGMSDSDATQASADALKRLDLYDVKDKVGIELSGGMKQRVLVSMILVSDAELLLLDEPSIGLDPVSRRQLWSYIKGLSATGHTILLTTHYMDEAEVLADNISIIHEGKVIVNGNLQQILERNNSKTILEITGNDLTWTRAYNDADSKNGRTTIELEEEEDEIVAEILRKARQNNSKVVFRRSTLEDLFVKLVGGGEVESA